MLRRQVVLLVRHTLSSHATNRAVHCTVSLQKEFDLSLDVTQTCLLDSIRRKEKLLLFFSQLVLLAQLTNFFQR